MRTYECAKNEFRRIAHLDYKYHDSVAYNRVLDEDKDYVMKDDFDPEDCDVRIASNPAQGSDVERIC